MPHSNTIMSISDIKKNMHIEYDKHVKMIISGEIEGTSIKRSSARVKPVFKIIPKISFTKN